MFKLTYFDFPGGRGETPRLIMALGDIEFEDERIDFETHAATLKDRPFAAVPVLDVDGILLTQSNTINRYLGKMAGLYPEDTLQAAYCDEIMSAIEDLTHMVVATFQMEEDEKKSTREVFVSGTLTTYLTRFEEYLKARGGEYFADNRLTIADLKMSVWIAGLNSGMLDYVPSDIVDTLAPKLNEHHQRINQHPKIVAHYAST